MENKLQNEIDDQYIREIFGIGDDPEGKKEIRDIRSRLRRLVFQHGQYICRIDGEPDGMYFLCSGTAVVLDRDGEQINMMHEGQYFGEYAVLTHEKRLSTVRSQGKTVVYRMEPEDVLQVLARHPQIYGEMMKRVYAQLSRKHRQVLELTRMRRGILQHPANRMPMTGKQMLLHQGMFFLIILLCTILIPPDSAAPVFLAPLVLMVAYVTISRRTVESLVAAGILAAALLYRKGILISFTDALLDTMRSPDNADTVFVMAMIGGFVSLAEASGAVTAFRKLAERVGKDRKRILFFSCAVMLLTAVDDGLNMICSAFAVNSSARKRSISREMLSVPHSILPTVLCSYLPFSLWGFFVLGTLNAAAGQDSAGLFLRSIPLNLYSAVSVAGMLLFCGGKLPYPAKLKAAEARVQSGGSLWPEKSEKYLNVVEPEVWGKLRNVMLPIAVLAAASVLTRSLFSGRLILDGACGLTAAILFMFFLYCVQGLMSPDEFLDHFIQGAADSTLPIVIYLLTMCLSTMMTQLALDGYFGQLAGIIAIAKPLFPAGLFLISVGLTMLLGSSWAMYAIAFPVALRLAAALGADPALCIGAVSAAGIAGEHNCRFTDYGFNVGTAIGCDPGAVEDVRIAYSRWFTLAAFLLYFGAGFLLE